MNNEKLMKKCLLTLAEYLEAHNIHIDEPEKFKKFFEGEIKIDLITQLTKAIPIVVEEIKMELEEECFEHPYDSDLPTEEYNRKRHRCPECWQTFFKKRGIE